MKDTIAFNEMMVHVPLCTHQEASNVLVIGTINEDIEKQLEKHAYANIEKGDVSLLNSKNDKDIDVIILTDVEVDEILLANINRILKDDGLITFATSAYSKNADKLKADLSLVGEKFWIAMPYRFGHNTSVIASKRHHPTADLNLQRADLLDGLEYYSAEIHNASFVFPAAEHKDLTGIAKR